MISLASNLLSDGTMPRGRPRGRGGRGNDAVAAAAPKPPRGRGGRGRARSTLVAADAPGPASKLDTGRQPSIYPEASGFFEQHRF